MFFIRSLYVTSKFYYALAGLVSLFVLAFFFPVLLPPAKILFGVLVILFLLDGLILYSLKKGVFARRIMQDKLSNGSENEIQIYLENNYNFAIATEVIDELPFQFQKRDSNFSVTVLKGQTSVITYWLRPVKRGIYLFGAINIFVQGPLHLVKRRYRFAQDQSVPVYPSFIQLHQYELLAVSDRLTELGIKRVRKIGHSSEFEQIRNYVPGDDPRVINWKASARRSELMVNNYQDEKSQQVYCIIDKGRVMQMPFKELSLLDYAINAALVISNIALKKQDKAGIITFAENIASVLPAERKASQMQQILEVLYNQKTRYLESDYDRLYSTIRNKIKQRSLLLIFSNFETLSGAQRRLPYLRRMAKHHLVLVIFFENTELSEVLQKPAQDTEAIYFKAIAEKFASEKRQIVKEFNRHGIHTILTPPEKLTINTINKYLEFKARGLI